MYRRREYRFAESRKFFFQAAPSLLCHYQIHGQQNRRWRVDRLGNGGSIKWNLVEQDFHVSERRKLLRTLARPRTFGQRRVCVITQ